MGLTSKSKEILPVLDYLNFKCAELSEFYSNQMWS